MSTAVDNRTVYKLIRDLRGLTPEDTANKIFDELGVVGHARFVLFPIVLKACADKERDGTRRVERSTGIGQPVDKVAELEFRQAVLSKLRKLLDRSFVYKQGNGSPRAESTWGKATVDVHQQRIVLLELTRDGVQESIDMHRTAVRALLESECSCLNDYYKRSKS